MIANKGCLQEGSILGAGLLLRREGTPVKGAEECGLAKCFLSAGPSHHARPMGWLVPRRMVGAPQQGPRTKQQAAGVDLGHGMSSVALGVPVLQPFSSLEWKLRPGEGLSRFPAPGSVWHTHSNVLMPSTTRHSSLHCPEEGLTAQREAKAGACSSPRSSGRAEQVLSRAT